MHYIRDRHVCTRCGVCAHDCSPMRFGLIEQAPVAQPESPHCERCGHCYSLCAVGAIRAVGEPAVPTNLSTDPTGGDAPTAPITAAALYRLLAARRSERRFEDRPVGPQGIQALLAAAAQTPSGGNARKIRCTIVPDNEVRRGLLAEIRRFYRRLLAVAKRPVTRAVAGALLGRVAGAFLNDPEYRRRFVALVEAIDSGTDPVFYGAPLVLLFHTDSLMPTPEEDAVLAAHNVALTATTLGLGTCFVSMAQKAIAASSSVKRAACLEKGQRVLAVLAIGYPTADRRRPVYRPAVVMEKVGGEV
jgi:nitroreductase